MRRPPELYGLHVNPANPCQSLGSGARELPTPGKRKESLQCQAQREFVGGGMASVELEQTVIEIPNGPEVNYLIGSKGAGINALQDATGTRIQIQRTHEVTQGAPERSVTIWGGEAQRLHCAQLIQSKVAECQQRDQARVNLAAAPNAASGSAQPQQEQTIIEIPNGPAVNYLIGSKGVGINALQDTTGTRIQIQRTHEVPPGALMRAVTIWGGDAQRETCARAIQQKMQECQQRDQARIHTQPRGMGGPPMVMPPHQQFHGGGWGGMIQQGMQETIINIPNGPEVNYLIGKQGAGINALQDATGTRIQIQRSHEVPPGALLRSVKIWGGDAQRQYCAQLIQTKVLECQQRDQARVNISGGMPGQFGAPNLMGMEQGMPGAMGGPFNLPMFGGYHVGPHAQAQHTQETLVIDIPNGPEVNYLIGKQGAGINSLQDSTGTRIQIQRTHEVPPGAMVRTVTIWGGEAQRAHCAQMIQQKVHECQQRDQARVNGLAVDSPSHQAHSPPSQQQQQQPQQQQQQQMPPQQQAPPSQQQQHQQMVEAFKKM